MLHSFSVPQPTPSAPCRAAMPSWTGPAALSGPGASAPAPSGPLAVLPCPHVGDGQARAGAPLTCGRAARARIGDGEPS